MHGPLIGWAAAVRNQPHEGGAAQGRESKGGGCQLPRLWGLLEERVKPFPWQRTRKRTRRQQRVRRSASGLKLPRARGHLANGEGASASRDGRPAALPCRARGKIFFSPPLVPFARARPRDRSRERCDCSRESEWAAWGGGGGGVAGWGGQGSAAALRLAPPGVAGRDGRVTCPGAERLSRPVSGVGSGEPAGRVQTAAGRRGLAAWVAGGRTVHFVLRSSILPCQRPSPGLRRCPNLRCRCLHQCHVAPRLAKHPNCAIK